ncbi:hypothetical protein [Nocardiopsis tropica]|uniref:Polyprenyl synthetase n=1 Tax=Nocardiopsis tropica TaxID=109330 RepID=A0ABU7KXK2_9ACTN|nr:hypothetical protein [Nocardiopsis umidischolae]MEE2054045.1 hypothetical protein [Nocardiopsis umidischolae]
MAHTGEGGATGAVGEPLLVAAGAADLALDRLGAALRRTRSLLGRSDLADLARDGRDDLRERGRLALQRYGPTPECHMEVLARRVASRTGQGDA